ncbi:unnamed protein product, partial [Meganyctiphanes norvegica]
MAQQSGGKDGEKNINPFQLSGSTSSTNLFGAATPGNSLFGNSITSSPQTQQTGLGTFSQGQIPVGSASFGLTSNANVGTFSTSGTQAPSGGLFSSSGGTSTAVSSAQIGSFGTNTFASLSKTNAFGTTNFGVSSSNVTASGTYSTGSFTTVSPSLFGNNTSSVSAVFSSRPVTSTIGFTNTTPTQMTFGKDGNSANFGSMHPVFSSGAIGFETTAVMSATPQPNTGYGSLGNSQIFTETSNPQPLPFGGEFVGKSKSSDKDCGSATVVPEIHRPFQGVDFNRSKISRQEISSVFGGAKDKSSLFGVKDKNDSEKQVHLDTKKDAERSVRNPSILLQSNTQSFNVPSPVPLSSNPYPGNTPPVFGGGNTKSEILISKSSKISKNTGHIFGGASSNRSVSGKVSQKMKGKVSHSDTKKSQVEHPCTEVEEGEIFDEQDELESNRYIKKSERQKGFEEQFRNQFGDEEVGGLPHSPDRKSITKIIVVQIPDSCFDKEMLRTHFSRFGKVERVSLNIRSKQATINFSDHEGASRAKRKGKKLHPKMPEVKIFYGTYARRKSEEESSTKKIVKEAKKTIRRSFSKEYDMDSNIRDYELDPYTPLQRPDTQASRPSLRDNSVGNMMKKIKSKQIMPQTDIIKNDSKKRITKKDSSKKIFSAGGSDEIDPYTPLERPILSAQKTNLRSKKKVIQRDIPDDLMSVMKNKNKQPRASSPSVRDKETTEVTGSTDRKTLENIIKSLAQNNNDKHNILKARDKLIRSQIRRSGEYLAATCPDMCPELERYKRDVQDYLSRYELTNDVLDHKKVTKSFSRSSADKDEPLPWELRPGPVLNMTMDYLLCNILPRVDNDDEDLKVWYGYLWDRTRAIRNDLMTQGLIDSVAVHIMERCCRFHIYCAVKFCDAPVSAMDPKMNNEHLSKSLVTLKERYFDLGEKGIYFESESEFMAYDMLFNLNSGQIMDQYVLYRDDVRKSKEVQYAVEVLHAVKTKNYVKFFKLVEKAAYLQGCILHRLFPQVRKDAISIIMKAYHTQKQRIPLSKIIKILGFEDSEDAIVYLSYYGFECHSSAEATEDFLIIDKEKFIKRPTETPRVVYPHRLIEESRNCSPAEIIQGGPLPKNPLDYHVPHDSFELHGKLKSESVNASDQLKFNYKSVEKGIDVIESSEHQKIKTLMSIIDANILSETIINVEVVPETETAKTIEDEPRPIPALTNAEKIECMKDIFDWISSEIFGDLIPPVAQDALSSIKVLYEKEAEKVVDEILFKNIKDEIKFVAVSAIKDITREEHERLKRMLQEEEKKRRHLEELKSVAIDFILSDYVSQFVPELSKSIASEAIDQIEEETLNEVVQELEKEMPLQLEVQTVNEEIKIIAQLVINNALDQKEKVEEFQEKMNRKICGQVLNKWRDLALLARRHKQAREEFPARASQLSLKEQNNVLGWGYDRKQNENLGITKLTEIHSTNHLEMKKIMLLKDIEKKVAWFTLSIPTLLKEDVDKCSTNNSVSSKNLLNHCFKILIITTPSVDPLILQWLRAKLNPEVNADITQPLKLCSSFVSKNTFLEYHVIMVEADLQVVYNDKNCESKGTNVVILVASEEDANGYALQQMQRIWKDMEVPGTIIIFGQQSLYDNIWYISPEDILDTKTSDKLQGLIMEGWYGRNRNLTLHHNSFADFVRSFVGDKVFDEAWKTNTERKSDFKSPLPFNAYVALYNQAIDHLIDVLKDKDLAYLSWPPEEASELKGMPHSSWNGRIVDECTKWLKKGRLPALNMEGYMTWDNIQSKVDGYIGTLSLSADALPLLLHEAHRILESYMVPDEENRNWEIHVLSLPWIKLTEEIASYKLNNIPNDEVYYQPNKINQFILPEAWYAACDSFDTTWIQGRGHPRTKKRKGILEGPFQQSQNKTFKSELRDAIGKEKEDGAKIEKEREAEIEEINKELRLIYGIEI